MMTCELKEIRLQQCSLKTWSNMQHAVVEASGEFLHLQIVKDALKLFYVAH